MANKSGKKPWNSPAKSQSWSPLQPVTGQAKVIGDSPLTPDESENRDFHTDQMEATSLDAKKKHGAISPAEVDRLSVLQTKMGGFWSRRGIRGGDTRPPGNFGDSPWIESETNTTDLNLRGVDLLAQFEPDGLGVFQRSPTRAAADSVIQMHHNKPLDDTTEADAEIYIITKDENATKASDVKDEDVVYVGQTCSQVGYQKRFQQHKRNRKEWEEENYKSLVIEKLKEVTQLETTAAEQYWVDHFKNKGSDLQNAINPLTGRKFKKYKTKKTFRGGEKGFPSGWKPAD